MHRRRFERRSQRRRVRGQGEKTSERIVEKRFRLVRRNRRGERFRRQIQRRVVAREIEMHFRIETNFDVLPVVRVRIGRGVRITIWTGRWFR